MRKPIWKWLLFASAAAIFAVILFYSNRLIKKIAQEERQRIEIWAGAITYKTQIINETERFFDSIRIEEGNQASIFAMAVKKVAEASLFEDITFYQAASSYGISNEILEETAEVCFEEGILIVVESEDG